MRLVAPITTTCPRESRPSMRASSVLTMLLWIWSCLLLLTCTASAIASHLPDILPMETAGLHERVGKCWRCGF